MIMSCIWFFGACKKSSPLNKWTPSVYCIISFLTNSIQISLPELSFSKCPDQLWHLFILKFSGAEFILLGVLMGYGLYPTAQKNTLSYLDFVKSSKVRTFIWLYLPFPTPSISLSIILGIIPSTLLQCVRLRINPTFWHTTYFPYCFTPLKVALSK